MQVRPFVVCHWENLGLELAIAQYNDTFCHWVGEGTQREYIEADGI